MFWMDYCSQCIGAAFRCPEMASIYLSQFGEIWIFGEAVNFLPEELAGIKMVRLKKYDKNIALRSLEGGFTVDNGKKIREEIEKHISYPNFEKRDALIMCLIQDWQSKDVLMHCFMNKEAWEQTQKTGYLWRYSTSQQKMQQKGETSGNKMKVLEIILDCDRDACLVKVEVLGKGEACHLKNQTCFFIKVQ